jgi:hypothetical protein
MNGRRSIAAMSAVALCCLLARASWAQDAGVDGGDGGVMVPFCSDTTMFPNPVYLTGSTAYQPTAGIFAAQLGHLAATAGQLTIIYQNSFGSCDAPPDIMNGTKLNGTATVWTPGPNWPGDPTNVVKGMCALDGSHAADVGVSDIFWVSCPGLPAQPTTIKDYQGPAQAMVFVVPAANTTFTAMNAAEAQLIWGCGAGGMVPGFDDDSGIQQRSATSGSQGLVSAAIHVPAANFFGMGNSSGGALVNSIATYITTHDASKAIGFIAGDLFDQDRGMFNPVAFQATNQNNAFYPDSTRDSNDRKNVRDGHYTVWGPEHFYVNVDATNGMPTSTAAAAFLGATFGTMYSSDFDYVELETRAGVIPQCAMQVTRGADGGPESPNSTNIDPCSCFYEKTRSNMTPTNCTACTGDMNCTGGKTCHHGFCE